MGPMVKLLPLHHPVRILEDMCVADHLTSGRLDFGVGRGVAPDRALLVRQQLAESRERFEDALGIICRALATGEISSEGSAFYDFPTDADGDDAVPAAHPVLVSGQPGRPPGVTA